MDNANQPAFGYGFCTADGTSHSEEKGLTKREYFAAMAMNGYCGGEYTGQSGMPLDRIAEWSVNMADALLKQLEK